MVSPSEASFEELITIRLLVLTATFIALVFLSTSLFYIALLSSSGFFNLGEAFVYLAALIGGPIVGGIAGGVGAAMADAFLGYGIFAPATLVLKGLEGFTVGSLYHSARKANITIRRIVLGIITLFILVFSLYLVCTRKEKNRNNISFYITACSFSIVFYFWANVFQCVCG